MRTSELFELFDKYLDESNAEEELKLKSNAPEEARKAFKEWLNEEKKADAEGIIL